MDKKEQPGEGRHFLDTVIDEFAARLKSALANPGSFNKTSIDREIDFLRKWLNRLLSGESNDNIAGPDITVLLTTEGKDKFLQIIDEYNIRISYECKEISDNIWKVSLPNSKWIGGFACMGFTVDQDYNAKTINLHYDDIIRMTSRDGSLWQNWHYDWAGNKIRTAPVQEPEKS